MNPNDVPAPPRGPQCFACRCAGQAGDTAFVAGLVFALQHNAAALLSRVCMTHRRMMANGHERTREGIRPEHRRG